MKGSHRRIPNGLALLWHRYRYRCCFPWTVRDHDRDGSGSPRSRQGSAPRSSYRECAGRICLCSCYPGIVSYPPPLVGWPLLSIQRQLGNPVRYPDLVTADREGAVWEHRRLLSGYDAVLRAVGVALRREFRDRIESGPPRISHPSCRSPQLMKRITLLPLGINQWQLFSPSI